MALSPLDIFNGIFSIIIIVIYSIIGSKIALRYRNTKDRAYILIGLTWIGLAMPWYSSSTSFIVGLFNDGLGLMPYPEIYYFLAIPGLPLITFFWLTGFTDLMYREKQKAIQIIFIIIGIVFDAICIYLVFTDASLILNLIGPVNSDYSILVLVYVLFTLGVLLTTGTLLARASLRSDNPVHKLKGRFLLSAFSLYVVGAIFDSAIDFTDLWLLLPRLILISSALCFYGGFILPEWVKNLFIKQQK